MKNSKKKWHDHTELCFDGDSYEEFKGAIVPPIFQNSLFTFKEWDDIDNAFDGIRDKNYVYSRLLNPTVNIAEEKIATICHAEKAKLYGSGMGAIAAAILYCVNSGDHIVTLKNIYGPANSFIGTYLKEKCGVSVTYVDGKDITEFEQAIQENTTLFYLESPTSIMFELQDLTAVSKLAKKHGIKTVIDNTWSTPIFQNPLDFGIDLEIHSASKYLGGHSDVVAGVIVGKAEHLDAMLMNEHALLGAKMAPFEGWLILRSLRTLHIRMKAHQEAGLNMALHLSQHPKVKQVFYPGLPSNAQYELSQNQMKGYSSLLSFELYTDDMQKIKAFVNALELFKLGVSWGGHDSLVYAPVISYIKELPPEKFKALGIKPAIIRISIGLEDIQDLKQDLENGFNKI